MFANQAAGGAALCGDRSESRDRVMPGRGGRAVGNWGGGLGCESRFASACDRQRDVRMLGGRCAAVTGPLASARNSAIEVESNDPQTTTCLR